jgi:hypothetical protein
VAQNLWVISSLAIAAYLLIQSICIFSTPNGLARMQGQPLGGLEYWDTANYVALAQQPRVSAFYPLWPWVISSISKLTGIALLPTAIVTSELIFLASFPLCLWVFLKLINNKTIAVSCFFLYVLGPNALFSAIGYTEAIFSFFSLLFLFCLFQYVRSWNLSYLALMLPLTVLMNLSRPVLIQTVFSVAACWGVTFGLSKLGLRKVSRVDLKRLGVLAVLIALAAIAGYSIYGGYCVSLGDGFFAPFRAQETWGRKLQLRPLLLLLPRALLIDLYGLYLPAALCAVYVVLGVRRARQRDASFPIPQGWGMLGLLHPALSVFLHKRFHRAELQGSVADSPAFSFVALYCLFFSGVHSLINFLANSGYLYSTARHYFGSPYAFLSIAYVSLWFERHKLSRLFGVVLVASVYLLGQLWISHTQGLWIG